MNLGPDVAGTLAITRSAGSFLKGGPNRWGITANDLIAYTHGGELHRYVNSNVEGEYWLNNHGHIGTGWNIFNSLI